ncbi:hypothetical protein M8J77_024710 [Diaphorina citri]|nr:hypothetical protein M8J77_024710 [Diaphorina citri]
MNTNRLRWLGHLMRIDKNRAVWKIFTNTPHQGKRLPGRPRSCWINEMKRLCNRWGLNDWEELTQHRVLWRQAVWSARDSHIPNTLSEFTTMLTEPILSHESEYPFPVVPTVLKLAGQGTSDSADSRARLVLYEPAHSGSITHLVDTIDRHHIGTESCPEISNQQQNG